jgi:hypothetical protein
MCSTGPEPSWIGSVMLGILLTDSSVNCIARLTEPQRSHPRELWHTVASGERRLPSASRDLYGASAKWRDNPVPAQAQTVSTFPRIRRCVRTWRMHHIGETDSIGRCIAMLDEIEGIAGLSLIVGSVLHLLIPRSLTASLAGAGLTSIGRLTYASWIAGAMPKLSWAPMPLTFGFVMAFPFCFFAGLPIACWRASRPLIGKGALAAHPIRLPRVRFTMRRLMIAVAVVAVILTAESFLFDIATDGVRSDDDPYPLGEAASVWVILNVVLSIPIWMSVAIIRAALSARARPKSASDGL